MPVSITSNTTVHEAQLFTEKGEPTLLTQAIRSFLESVDFSGLFTEPNDLPVAEGESEGDPALRHASGQSVAEAADLSDLAGMFEWFTSNCISETKDDGSKSIADSMRKKAIETAFPGISEGNHKTGAVEHAISSVLSQGAVGRLYEGDAPVGPAVFLSEMGGDRPYESFVKAKRAELTGSSTVGKRTAPSVKGNGMSEGKIATFTALAVDGASLTEMEKKKGKDNGDDDYKGKKKGDDYKGKKKDEGRKPRGSAPSINESVSAAATAVKRMTGTDKK